MLDRDDILRKLEDGPDGVGAENLSIAESLAKRDSEVAAALRFYRAMTALDETRVFGRPRNSDAEFLVTLRQRLDATARPVPQSLFGGMKHYGMAGAVCLLFMFVVLTGGYRGEQPLLNSHASAYVDPLESGLAELDLVEMDSVEADAAQVESLAVFLGVAELAENWDFSETDGELLTDQLLSMDPQSLEEVLHDFETAHFF